MSSIWRCLGSEREEGTSGLAAGLGRKFLETEGPRTQISTQGRACPQPPSLCSMVIDYLLCPDIFLGAVVLQERRQTWFVHKVMEADIKRMTTNSTVQLVPL